MSTAAMQRKAFQLAPSTCLPENSHRPMTLCDMQKFYAATLTTLTWKLNSLWMEIEEHDAASKIGTTLQGIREEALKLEWADLAAQVDRFLNRIFTPKGVDLNDHPVITSMFIELQGNIQYYLTRDLFICIQNPKIDYISRPRENFGESILEKFPSASYDVKEASTCFALDRWTASVFHLMRVLEIGLRILAGRFSVSTDHANWEQIINQIEKAIASMDKDPQKLPNWKDDREFYSQCASHFRSVKDAWRNYTAHARGKYDEREAFDMFNNVRGFMEKLSTRFGE